MKILFFFHSSGIFWPKTLITRHSLILCSLIQSPSLQFVSSSQLCRTKSKAMNSLTTSFAARFPARAEQVFCNRVRSFALFRPPRTHRTPRIVCMAVGTVSDENTHRNFILFEKFIYLLSFGRTFLKHVFRFE